MPSFKDANGREWLIKLDGPKIKEVRAECGVDFASLDGNTFQRLESDPCLLVDVLWVICRSQSAINTTPANFGEAMVGDPIEAATQALLEAIADFFPARKRLLLRSLAAKQTAVMQKGLDLALAKLNDPALEATLVQAMESQMTKELTSLLTGRIGATSQPDTAESALTG
jgi:hypothetical protein